MFWDQLLPIQPPAPLYNIFERISFRTYEKLPRWQPHYPNPKWLNNVMRDYRSIAWHSPFRTVYPHSLGFRMLRAITLNDIGEVKQILNNKSYDLNKDVVDKKYNMNALMYATIIDRYAIIQLLLLHGANINKADQLGNTPLMLAVNNQNLEAINTLLKNGCNRYIKNRYGLTPLDKALENYFSPHIAQFIKQYPQTARRFPKFRVKLNLNLRHPMWDFIEQYKIYDKQAKLFPFNDFKGTYRADFSSHKTVKQILQLQRQQPKTLPIK